MDGRRRYDGVDAFLRSRGIVLPSGAPSDPAGQATVCGLGNAKNRYFEDGLRRVGVRLYPDAIALIRAARMRGVLTAVVSASENCDAILTRAPASTVATRRRNCWMPVLTSCTQT